MSGGGGVHLALVEACSSDTSFVTAFPAQCVETLTFEVLFAKPSQNWNLNFLEPSIFTDCPPNDCTTCFFFLLERLID